MGDYIPSTKDEQQEMLASIGLNKMEDLFAAAPEALMLKELNIPEAKSELEVYKMFDDMASKNIVFKNIFRGAGAYNHYIPSIVKNVVTKETFLTAYTPYQAEISQGILQSIFEYQTMICELTGMDSSNASVYDGASAAAEAVSMCIERKRVKAFVSETSHPDVIETVKTYCWANNSEVVIIPAKDGKTDLEFLEKNLDDTSACVYIQSPNYYGQIEEAQKCGEIAHNAGAKFIMGVNPIASAIYKTAKEYGADIAVGEGQPLGMSIAFGGPYLGFMAATEKMTRKLPGRIVGETKDVDGKRAYVLTLQAREQHIRREKASSNICSNQALCATTATVYLAAMGPEGLKDAATLSMSKAHYLANELCKIDGFELKYKGEFFHEFVTTCPVDTCKLMKHLEDNGVLGGLPIESGILWCATEMNSKEDIDNLVRLVSEVAK